MVFRTFTQTYDLNTEVGSPVLLGIHTPIGGDAWRFLYPFFQAYKKFKYLGCDITIVNAARLPYDPEQIGKVEGENYVDPRDSLNPILFKGCHGEDLGEVLNSMYGGLTSDAFKRSTLDKQTLNSVFENFYYTALGDDSWRKSPIQKTLRIRGLHPLVYGLGTNHQIMPSNNMLAADYAENTSYYDSTRVNPSDVQSGSLNAGASEVSRPFIITPTKMKDTVNNGDVFRMLGSLFTNKVSRLGWLDTLQLSGSEDSAYAFNQNKVTELPKIFMGLLMLPPSYLCRSYLRVLITHKWKFSGYRTITTGGAYPTFEPGGAPIGYAYEITGNVPSAGTTSKSDLERMDTTDYDAIEEKDEDGPSEEV